MPRSEELDRLIAQTCVPEDIYKADMELHVQSQKLSSELLRLSLAGIAVIGFLLANIPEGKAGKVFSDATLMIFVTGSVTAFTVVVLFVLLQTFYASGAMFHHLKCIKLLQQENETFHIKANEAMHVRSTKFEQAQLFLKLSSGLLVVAAGLLGAAFIKWMSIL